MTTTLGTNIGSIELNTVTKVSTASQVTSTVDVSTITVGETSYMFMRAKTITFTVTGLKPNTRYYPFFNGVDVSAYCSTVDGQTSSQLVTNRLGDMTGNFYLPSNTFVAGSHSFQLVDNVRTVSGINIPDPISGRAEARYEANGILKRQQTQVTVNSEVTTDTTVTSVSTPTATVGGVQVPLATLLNSLVNPPPVVQCKSWYFEYAVFNAADTRVVTIPTNNSARPSNAQIEAAIAGFGVSPTYITTSRAGANTWYHTYAVRTRAGGSDSNVTVYRQEWIGATTELPPDIASFRPSGIAAASGVSIVVPWTEIGVAACPVNRGYGIAAQIASGTSLRWDPIAQSFFVDPTAYPQGMFVTSINIYFRRADQSTPVILELRNMANGLPGSNVLPGGKVLVPGSAAAQSPDASIPTKFQFDQPVYLQANTDYCFVVRSPSLGYEAWCSKIGEIDVATDTVIDTQPFTGSLFLSENNYTWVPDSTQDLKFDLNVAVFDTNVSADIIFYPQTATGSSNYYGTAHSLPLSFIYTIKGSKVVQVKIPMHSLVTGDKIVIEGIAEPTPATAYNNILAANLNGEFVVTVIDEDLVSITTTGNNASKSGFLPVNDIAVEIDTQLATPNPAQTPPVAIPFINDDNFASSTIPTGVVAPSVPTTPSLSSTNRFRVYTNILVNELMVDSLTTNFDGNTSVIERVSIATGKSTAGSEVPYSFQPFLELPNADQFYEFNQPRMIATPANETIHSTELSGNRSLAVNVRMSSGNKNISPVLDLNGMTLMTRTYTIDNQNGELSTPVNAGSFVVGRPYVINTVGTTNFTLIGAPSNTPGVAFIATGTGTGTGNAYYNSEILSGRGNALAKYKSPIHTLDTFHDKVRIFVTANSLAPAVIDAYVRTSADADTHVDRNWSWVPINGVYGTQFSPSISKLTLSEWMYELDISEPFNVYDIKLVMRSTNNSIVPKIYSIRTIVDPV